MGGGLPVTLTHLENKLCLVVGGGHVAERKVIALRDANANVRIIAPTLTEGLAARVHAGDVAWFSREYQAGDLADAFLVIAATNDPQINRAIAQEAIQRGLLVNVVDDPEYCNFIASAVVRRGDLTISVCTGGSAPALSAHLRGQLEQQFGSEWASYVTRLAGLRDRIAVRYPDVNTRRQVWAHLLSADLASLFEADDDHRVDQWLEGFED